MLVYGLCYAICKVFLVVAKGVAMVLCEVPKVLV